MSELERRTFPVEDADVEVRQTEGGGEEFVLSGHAAVFDTRSKPLGPPGQRFVEQIEPGAFSNALEGSDIRALFNHDPSELLARESAGTLDVGEDSEGLRYEASLGDDTRSEFVRSKVERGEVTGNSFSFVVSEEHESWNHDPDDAEFPVRTIHEFDRVDDVGPVSYPAYPDATISERVEKRAAQMQGQDEESDEVQTVEVEEVDMDLSDLPEPQSPAEAERDRAWVRVLTSESENRQSRPEFDGVEDRVPDWVDEGSWDRPALSDHPEAGEGDEFSDLSEDDQNAVRGRFIEKEGDTYSDLGNPVVNPDTDNLNRNGVLAARQRPSSDEAESIADALWEEHFAEDDEEENSLRRRRIRLEALR